LEEYLKKGVRDKTDFDLGLKKVKIQLQRNLEQVESYDERVARIEK